MKRSTAKVEFGLDGGGPLQLGEWHFKEELSATPTSSILKVEHGKTGEIYVDKWYDLRSLQRLYYGGEDPRQRIEREIHLLSSCDHPHIQKLVEVFDDPDSQTVHLLQPFAPLGSLQNVLPSQQQLCLCFSQIADALHYLHSRSVVHRDIKPSNILCFGNDRFVLSDFSSASVLTENGKLEDTQGSPAFLSPEECQGGEFDGRSADVWAFGVTLFAASFQGFPFEIRPRNEADFVQTFMAVTRCLANNKLTIPDEADERLKILIQTCLERDPTLRPSFAEVIRSDWFQRKSQ
jgi:serine/threonine protein kinase